LCVRGIPSRIWVYSSLPPSCMSSHMNSSRRSRDFPRWHFGLRLQPCWYSCRRTEALDRFAGGHVTVQNNAIVLSGKRDYWITRYPSRNLYPESYVTVGFTNLQSNDYSLRASSSLKRNATDKSDVGVDLAQLAGTGVLKEASLAK
jgi:hypothetical protein